MTQDAQSVTQEDIDRANEWRIAFMGHADDLGTMALQELAQDFAAHRLASQPTSAEDAVSLAGRLEALAGDCDNTDGWQGASADVRQAAEIIRTVSRPTPDTQTAAIGAEARDAKAISDCHNNHDLAVYWRQEAMKARLSYSTPGDAEVREALRDARDALLTVGNDYPGSSCQQWCTDKAREVWNVLEPWRYCPSTHCERAHECRSVNECSAERATLATPSGRAQAWLPWGTAPEDGSVVLAYRDDAGVFTAHYVEEDAHLSNPMNPPEGECFWFTTGGEDLTGDMPTHWQPLPAAPPAQDQTKGDEA